MHLETLQAKKSNKAFPAAPHFIIEDEHYIARLAKTSIELDEALKLRFEVFNLEMGEGLQSSFQTLRDEDDFDQQCHHLIIIHKASQKIIGTYRMQSYDIAKEGKGFYSNDEFVLDSLPVSIIKNAAELGRACIARDFRNKKTLYLLWCGIARYAQHTEKRYLFGCCSLKSQDDLEGLKLWQQLKEADHLDKNHLIGTRPDYTIRANKLKANQPEIEMPPLLGMYLRYGATVISHPAIDRAFKTIDYLVLLDTFALSPIARRMFFGE